MPSSQIELSNLNPSVIVASHPRSGTHLTLDLLRHQFSGCNVNKRRFSFRDNSSINLDEILSYDTAISRNELKGYTKSKIPLIKKHRLPVFLEPFQFLNPVSKARLELAQYLEKNTRKIYVYRNVKSTMISLYYFVPESERGRDIHDFIRQVRGRRQLSRIGFWAYHVSQWMKCDNVLVLDYDKLLKETEQCLHELSGMLNEFPLMQMPLLPIPPKSLLSRRLGIFFSRRPGSSAVLSFETRNYTVDSFTDSDDQYIKSEIETVAPDLWSRISTKS